MASKNSERMCYDFLYDYLEDCYERLKRYCHANNLEDRNGDGGRRKLRLNPETADLLSRVNFRGGELPDYSDPHVQELYCIRYMYAYAYEYRKMYSRLLKELKTPLMNILSVGCGNGIDLWAAWEAQWRLKQKSGRGKQIKYTGLDLVDWNHKWGEGDFRLQCTADYQTGDPSGDAVQYLEEHPVLEQNIFMFPKSISEFTNTDFGRISRAFAKAKFQYEQDGCMKDRKKVYFLVSFRYNGMGSLEKLEDKKRSDRLVKAMERNRFSLDDENEAQVFVGSPDKTIAECDRNLEYVNTYFYERYDVKNFLEELKRKDNGIFAPMQATKYSCYRIMTFVREKA